MEVTEARTPHSGRLCPRPHPPEFSPGLLRHRDESYLAVMSSAKLQWVFICAGNRTWSWRAVQTEDMAGPFASLDEATAHAMERGFDPFGQYWIARKDGRATHYRPGKSPENLPTDEALKD